MHGLTLLSPLGLLLVLAALVPILGLAVAERRAARVGRLLRLTQPNRRRRAEIAGALVVVAALLGVAAAQPVVGSSQRIHVDENAEALFVFDVSRSMGAAPSAHAPTRLDDAKRLALAIRSQLGGVQAGAASLTRRVLPYLFPTADEGVFDTTVSQAVQIESPPPGTPTFAQLLNGTHGLATDLTGLVFVPTQSFFSAKATHRLLLVFTDGESSPVALGSIGSIFHSEPRVHLILVRVGGPGDRIYVRGRPDPRYRPRADAAAILRTVARVGGGTVFSQHDEHGIVSKSRAALAGGHVVSRRSKQTRQPLAAWFAAGAVLPLLLVLRRRNL
jgi:hypothetical protein